MFDSLLMPARALLVAAAGAALAWLWFKGYWWAALGLALIGCFIGSGAEAIGRRLLPRRPVPAVHFLEWWQLTPAMVAAVASGAVIVITVALAVPDTDPTWHKETIGALSTGLTGFLTAAFISWTGDESDSTVSDRIRSIFWSVYEGKFKPGSAGQRWVYSDEFKTIQGWGRTARITRAKGIDERMRHDLRSD